MQGIVPVAASATVELKLVAYAPLRGALRKASGLVSGQEHLAVHLAAQVDDIRCSIVSDSPRLALVTAKVFWERRWVPSCTGRGWPSRPIR